MGNRLWTLILCSLNLCSIEFIYHNYAAVTTKFKQLEASYPQLCHLYSIGQSVEGLELWVLQITDDVKHRSLLRPRVKWVANMHGDEAVGRELTIQMAEYLLFNYKQNSTVADFLQKIDLHLMPSLNPDGFEKSKEGRCQGGFRNNANLIDLNRNFPDQFRDPDWPITRKTKMNLEKETLAMINWIESSNFVLSLNLHAGSVVASYPYDDSSTIRSSMYSKSPDDEMFKYLATIYADNNEIMKKADGKSCNEKEMSFHHGITNGADWYQVPGGMEDYNYLHGDCFEITIELTCCKYPPANVLESEWILNKESLWRYSMAAYQGVHGFVLDRKGKFIAGAEIGLNKIDKVVHSDPNGAFWRLLLPGEYKLQISAEGYNNVNQKVIIGKNTLFVNITMDITTEEYKDDGQIEFIHHGYVSLTNLLKELATKFPNLCKLSSAGQSSEKRELWVMEISDNPGTKELFEPEFKYVANMHGNEVKGREISIAMIQYLLNNYNKIPRITNLIDNHRLFFMPSMNPDGNNKAYNEVVSHGIHYEKVKYQSLFRETANKIDLNRDFPDHFQDRKLNPRAAETKVMMNWMKSHNFVLSLNSHGGALVANYPYDDSANIGRHRRNIPSLSDDNDVFVYLAKTYANAHPTMSEGKSCRSDKIGLEENDKVAKQYGIEYFPGGIVNGEEWYPVAGGMQDWNYFNTNAFEVTIEIGCIKFPDQKFLKQYFEANLEPTLQYIEQSYIGIHGQVTDTNGNIIENALIKIDQREKAIFTSSVGDFFRPLMPGTYSLSISKAGFGDYSDDITIPGSGVLERNFTLLKSGENFQDNDIESLLSSVMDNGLLQADADAEEIEEDFEYGIENESLPNPISVDELVHIIQYTSTAAVEEKDQTTMFKFDPEQFLRPQESSFVTTYVIILAFAVIMLLVARVWYVRNQARSTRGFMRLPQDYMDTSETTRLTAKEIDDVASYRNYRNGIFSVSSHINRRKRIKLSCKIM